MGTRRKARECALQALYQIDMTQSGPEEALAALWRDFAEEKPEDDVRTFAETLVRGVAGHLADIDARIQSNSDHWRLERMAKVDRNVLRLATFELLHLADVPMKVTLNEAVELGKTFGSEESSAFINGILDRIARGIGKE
jgi:N utilization substance protein B